MVLILVGEKQFVHKFVVVCFARIYNGSWEVWLELERIKCINISDHSILYRFFIRQILSIFFNIT